MRFGEYERWLTEQIGQLKLESVSTTIGPYLTPTSIPNKPPWQMELTVVFDDGMFLRVCENWYRRKTVLGGAGFRGHFSFHYGPANPQRDEEGGPMRSKAYPPLIRVDQDDRIGSHLHYNGEDHIPQNRVENFRISDADMFDFIRAVQIHRVSGDSFDKIMKFTVNP